jgi:hypothetical protein
MAIVAVFPNGVTVNGFACHTSTAVALAARHIDPASADPAVRRQSTGPEPTRNHFAPEARRPDMLEDLHKQARLNAANPLAAAYGAAGTTAAPGQFVDRTA